MISESSLRLYEESGLEGQCMFVLPSCKPMIGFPDGLTYEAPWTETDEEFLDRIDRSKKVGRNLFREEWELDEISQGIDVLY